MSLNDSEKKTTDFNLAGFFREKTIWNEGHKAEKTHKEKDTEKTRLKSLCNKGKEDDDGEDKDHWNHPKRKGQPTA